MTMARGSAAATPSPNQNRANSLFVTGGHNTQGSSINTGDVLTENGWQKLPSPLLLEMKGHCMVLLNSTTVFIIGGFLDGTPYSTKTFYFDTENNEWVAGPKLLTGRSYHSCGKLRENNESSLFSVIVAGGYNTVHILSVEILDSGASEWRMGFNLAVGIWAASMVEDKMGGVLLIGGNNKSLPLNTLYRLPHANSDWILLPQKLKVSRSFATAFLVPDEIANCN